MEMKGRMSSATRLLVMAVFFFSEWNYSNSGRPPLPHCKTRKSCFPSSWAPELKWTWKDDQNISISFDPPPSMLKFTHFNVTLSKDKDKVNQRKINSHSITYTLICNGQYTFEIQPIDDYQWEIEKCYCYDGHDRCQWCKRTSINFEFTTGEYCSKPKNGTNVATEVYATTPSIGVIINDKGPSSDPPVVEESTNSRHVSQPNPDLLGNSKAKNIIFISAGIVVAVILALVVVYFMFKSKNSSSSGILQNYDNLVPEEETLATKNVLLLFSNDHDFHYNVVNCLTSSLENNFKCHILYTPCITEKGILQWLHKTVAECDVVLLLHSESVKRQCDAWRVGKEYSQLRDDPNESMLMPILAHLQTCPKVQPYYSKFVSCRLKHLADKYILHDFPSRDNFVLVKELKELVCRLHQLPPNSNLKKAFKISLDSYHNTPKGQSLIQAIDRAATQEENPNWFLDKYKCAEYCTESTTDKCDCTSIFISDYQNGGIDYLKTQVDGRHDRCLPKPYFNDINSVSDISHTSTMLADINERNDRSLKNRNSFLETLPDDMHDLSM